jgi:hypothetical protein
MDKTETEVIDTPQTNEEHLKYAWKGVKMAAGSSATLAWRGTKAVCCKVAGWIKTVRENRKGKEGAAENVENNKETEKAE